MTTGLAPGIAGGFACSAEDVPPDYEVSAEHYVESYCDSVCNVADQCSDAMPEARAECLDECFMFADFNITDTPNGCYEVETEYNRCRFERLTCEQIYDPDSLSAGPPEDSPCRDAYEVWWSCVQS